jgi:lysophospholipase L1-like esterase
MASRQGRVVRRLLIAGLAIGALVSATALPAAAAPEHEQGGWPTAITDYLALGDSVAFGYRPPQVTPAAEYLNAANFVGYPEYLSQLEGLRVANASCPGETTASMIVPGAQSNGCENAPGSSVGYRTAYPLHVSYSGTQLAYAVQYLRQHTNTELVTINIGANDVFLCQETTTDQCTGSDFGKTLAEISTNLATIYAALRNQGHYHGKLVLLDYYSLSYATAADEAGTEAIDAALAATTKEYGGIVADGFGAFERASAAYGGDACAAGLLIPLPTGGCNVHPTAHGARILAEAIAQAIRPRPAGL